MPCYHPSEVDVERKSVGDFPRRKDVVRVPCGHCLGCRTDQARQWAIRIVHESRTRPPAFFTTLTYDPEELPENGSLDKDHPQLFIKRLRRRIEGRISYYLCGEYGERSERPHYHAVLFGYEFPDRSYHDTRNGAPVWTSRELERAWSHGLCELTPVSYQAAAYVAGYVRKKVRQRDDPEHYKRYDPSTGEIVQLVPEFGRMSRRPAIGREWIEQYWPDVYPRDFVVMDGQPQKPPRYYDKWMEDNEGEIMEEVRLQRWKDREEIGDPKLIMKEKVHRARVELFQGRDKI